MAKTFTVDRLGRIVLPKRLRERYALNPGVALELTDTGSGILLTPRRVPTSLKQLRNGFPVLSLSGQTDVDVAALVERTRDERDARTARGSDGGTTG